MTDTGRQMRRLAVGWGLTVAVASAGCGEETLTGGANPDAARPHAPETDASAPEAGSSARKADASVVEPDAGGGSDVPEAGPNVATGCLSAAGNGVAGCQPELDGCAPGSTLPNSVSGNTTLGFDDFQDGCYPSLGGARDVEYLFAAPADGIYLFTVTGTSELDPILYVFDGACTGSEIACANNGARSAISLPLQAGQIITVVVEGRAATDGEFTLNVSPLAGVCPDEDLGSALPTRVSGTTVGKLNSAVSLCGDLDSPDHTYLWTAPATGLYGFSLTGLSFESVLYVHDGVCRGRELSCNASIEPQSRFDLSLSAGQTVSVTVEGRGAGGAYELAINRLDCPVGDAGDIGDAGGSACPGD